MKTNHYLPLPCNFEEDFEMVEYLLIIYQFKLVMAINI